MALTVHMNTGLSEDELPRIYKTVWDKGSKMRAAYIATAPDTLLFMPREEAAAWIIKNHNGELKNMRVHAQNGFKDTEITKPAPTFNMYGGERSLKDRSLYLSIANFSYKEDNTDPNHKLKAIAQRALMQVPLKWRS